MMDSYTFFIFDYSFRVSVIVVHFMDIILGGDDVDSNMGVVLDRAILVI